MPHRMDQSSRGYHCIDIGLASVVVGHQSLLHFLISVLPTPDLSPANKETLIASEAVHDRCILALTGQLVGCVRYANSTQVTDGSHPRSTCR